MLRYLGKGVIDALPFRRHRIRQRTKLQCMHPDKRQFGGNPDPRHHVGGNGRRIGKQDVAVDLRAIVLRKNEFQQLFGLGAVILPNWDCN